MYQQDHRLYLDKGIISMLLRTRKKDNYDLLQDSIRKSIPIMKQSKKEVKILGKKSRKYQTTLSNYTQKKHKRKKENM